MYKNLIEFTVYLYCIRSSLDSACPCLQSLHMPLLMSGMDWLFVELHIHTYVHNRHTYVHNRHTHIHTYIHTYRKSRKIRG